MTYYKYRVFDTRDFKTVSLTKNENEALELVLSNKYYDYEECAKW